MQITHRLSGEVVGAPGLGDEVLRRHVGQVGAVAPRLGAEGRRLRVVELHAPWAYAG